jgi:RNA polymerase sigma factor (sigma-70 family)
MVDDVELLHRYVADRSQTAFTELVQRHLNLVYSVALRQVGGDSHLAEDVVQQVFSALARKAATLTHRPTLSGWLFRSTHFAASDIVRVERRRRAREQEAHTMERRDSLDSPSAMPGGEAIDWDKVRPTIDAAIAELDEDDRDAVSLRFFDGCSFGDVGARLRLSENAARMRVVRALDKLHAVLARRGVTSTTAALGLALANQVAVGAPAGLAASVTGAALAGSAAGGAGILAFMSTSKIVAGIGAGVTAAALTVAVVQHDEKNQVEVALASAEQQRHAAQAQLASLTARLAQAEQRAGEAEKDSGDLLRAVEALRTEQAAQAARSARSGVFGGAATGLIGGITGMVQAPVGSSPEEAERLAHERGYQQQLARRRAEEAKARAQIDQDASRAPDATARYHLLVDAAERLAEKAEFQAAIRTYNQAMQAKPAELEVSARVKELQATLASQNAPVDITLSSDGLTWVSIVNFRAPQKVSVTSLRILPGNYEVVGRRAGYKDVVIQLPVRNGVPVPAISVICTVPAAP